MIDRNKVEKLRNRDYRVAYVASRVRTAIALQIRALREQRGLSQTDFAQLLGKKQSVVSRIENTEHTVSVNTLLDIARSLDVGLVVKFCSYGEFFHLLGDVSPKTLMVDSYSGESPQFAPTQPISSGLADKISSNSGQREPVLPRLSEPESLQSISRQTTTAAKAA